MRIFRTVRVDKSGFFKQTRNSSILEEGALCYGSSAQYVDTISVY